MREFLQAIKQVLVEQRIVKPQPLWKIVEELLIILDKMIQRPPQEPEQYSAVTVFLLSQLRTLQHQRRLLEGKNVYAEVDDALQKMIIATESKLATMPRGVTQADAILSLSHDPASVIPRADNSADEEIMRTEQQRLEESDKFAKLLERVWLKALAATKRSKRIFISYSWSDPTGQEAWTDGFIETSVKHLNASGVSVYLDRHHSGEGFPLADYMGKILGVDHVLVIGTRTMETKLQRDDSGTSYEHRKILERVNSDKSLLQRRFVIPVLLTHANHTHANWRELAEIGMCTQGYLESLRSLLCRLHQFGEVEFKQWWQEQQRALKLVNNTWNIPLSNPNFINRDEYMSQMRLHLGSPEVQRLVLTTSGLGGVGKTQLAIAYVERNYPRFKEVCWFTADTREDLIRQYLQFGYEHNIAGAQDKTLSGDERAQSVMRWLDQEGGRLLVYDNVSKWDDVYDLIPHNHNKVLVTSRHQKWPGIVLEIGVFTERQARDYIERALGIEFYQRNVDELELFIKTLGRLPLAIAQACAYIRQEKISLAAYLQLYTQNRRQMHSENRLPPEEKHPAVAVTWNITMQRLRAQLPMAHTVLMHCAFMHADNIPMFLIERYLDSQGMADPIRQKKIIQLLADYSMISNYDQTQFSMHRVLQEVIVDQLIKDTCVEQQNHLTAIEIICNISVSIGYEVDNLESNHYQNTRTGITKYPTILPHLEKIVAYLDVLWPVQDEEIQEIEPIRINLFILLGRLNRLVLNPRRALIFYKKASARFTLFDALFPQCNCDNSDPEFEKFKLRIETQRPDFLKDLGLTYVLCNEFRAGIETLHKALLIFENGLPDVSLQSVEVVKATILANLAEANLAIYADSNAINFMERALIIFRNYLHESHPFIASGNAVLAFAMARKGVAPQRISTMFQGSAAALRNHNPADPALAVALVNSSLTTLSTAMMVSTFDNRIKLNSDSVAQLTRTERDLHEALRICKAQSDGFPSIARRVYYLLSMSQLLQNNAILYQRNYRLALQIDSRPDSHLARSQESVLFLVCSSFCKMVLTRGSPKLRVEYGLSLYREYVFDQKPVLSEAISALENAIQINTDNECLEYENEDNILFDDPIKSLIIEKDGLSVEAKALAYYHLAKCFRLANREQELITCLERFNQYLDKSRGSASSYRLCAFAHNLVQQDQDAILNSALADFIEVELTSESPTFRVR